MCSPFAPEVHRPVSLIVQECGRTFRTRTLHCAASCEKKNSWAASGANGWNKYMTRQISDTYRAAMTKPHPNEVQSRPVLPRRVPQKFCVHSLFLQSELLCSAHRGLLSIFHYYRNNSAWLVLLLVVLQAVQLLHLSQVQTSFWTLRLETPVINIMFHSHTKREAKLLVFGVSKMYRRLVFALNNNTNFQDFFAITSSKCQ
jgi:hypothetical protein